MFDNRWIERKLIRTPRNLAKLMQNSAHRTLADEVHNRLLDLDGSFKSFDMMALLISSSLDHAIILGITRTDQPITLYKCHVRTRLDCGRELSECIAEIAIVGHLFQRVDDIKFTGMTAGYLHLPEWTELSGFRRKLNRRSVTVAYAFPKPMIARLDDMKVTFGVGYKSDVRRQAASIEQTGYVSLKFRKQHHIDQCKNFLGHIQEFLTLGMSEPTKPISVSAMRSRERGAQDTSRNDPLSIYFLANPVDPTDRELYSHAMLFTLRDIGENLGDCLQHWFSTAVSLRPAYDLYFGTIFNRQGYSNWVFLNYIQALEAYDRRVSDTGQYVSEAEFIPIWEKLVQAIPADVEGPFRSSLRDKMKYMYEYSLKKRIRLLLKKHKEQVAMLIPAFDPFIDEVVTKRNHLTHYTEELEQLAVKDEEFWLLVQRVRFLLEVCFMSEIGIPAVVPQ